MKRFAKIVSGNRVLDQVQDNISIVLNPIATSPSLQRILLGSVSLVMGMNSVPHTLGRALMGWTVVRLRAEMLVWETKDPDDKFLYLSVSAPGTVDLEVF